MPLRAEINGEAFISAFMTDDEWQALKTQAKQNKLDIRMPCCANTGHMRTSSRGLNHFAHNKRGNCTSGSETWQHLKAKFEIARACREAGYKAITEASGDGWRADVLATNGDKIKIAFEVQWSHQTLEETIERQQRYTDAGIRCCWLFRKPPNDFQANKELPLFQIDVTEDECNILFSPHEYDRYFPRFQTYSLSKFIADMLTYKLKFCDGLRNKQQQVIQVTFAELSCWRCNAPYQVWKVSELETPCKVHISPLDETWGDEKFYFHPKIREGIARFINSTDGQHINLSTVKKRYSKTVKKSYMSFGCPRCNAICGDFFLDREIYDALKYKDNPTVIEIPMELDRMEWRSYNHWCYSEGGIFCC